MRVVDLGMVIAPAPDDPSVRGIERWAHEDGPERLAAIAEPYLSRLAEQEQWDSVPRLEGALPEGFLSNDVVTLTVHAGTHVDAPWHYGRLSEGSPAKTVEELPIDWFVGPGIKLSVPDLAPGEPIRAEHLEQAVQAAGRQPRPREVVLIETGWDSRWPAAEYFDAHPGMSIEALELLLDCGVKVIGIDTAGFDRPAPLMLRDYGRTGDPSVLWPCHLYGRRREYVQIERLSGLSALPPTGWTIVCPPVRVRDASGGWTRPVALVPGPEPTLVDAGPDRG